MYFFRGHYSSHIKNVLLKKKQRAGAGVSCDAIGFLSFSLYQWLNHSAKGTQPGEPGESAIVCHAERLPIGLAI